ncbi:MAG: hypothetical protein EOO73_17155 [Myxococcales bacterium]|nr:MAG: hypothetical protein EOO73_17155 [Myxococcales bacterium]
MQRLVICLVSLSVGLAVACSQSAPVIDTPATLPPAEPPADVSRDSPSAPPDKAAEAGKQDSQAEDSGPPAKP